MNHRGVENYLKEVSVCDFIVVSGSDEFQEQGKKKCKALQTKIAMWTRTGDTSKCYVNLLWRCSEIVQGMKLVIWSLAYIWFLEYPLNNAWCVPPHTPRIVSWLQVKESIKFHELNISQSVSKTLAIVDMAVHAENLLVSLYPNKKCVCIMHMIIYPYEFLINYLKTFSMSVGYLGNFSKV